MNSSIASGYVSPSGTPIAGRRRLADSRVGRSTAVGSLSTRSWRRHAESGPTGGIPGPLRQRAEFRDWRSLFRRRVINSTSAALYRAVASLRMLASEHYLAAVLEAGEVSRMVDRWGRARRSSSIPDGTEPGRRRATPLRLPRSCGAIPTHSNRWRLSSRTRRCRPRSSLPLLTASERGSSETATYACSPVSLPTVMTTLWKPTSTSTASTRCSPRS